MSLKLFKCYTIFVLITVMCATFTPQAGDEEKLNTPPKGFTALFNGKNLDGFKGLVGGPPKLASLTKEQLKEAQTKADKLRLPQWPTSPA